MCVVTGKISYEDRDCCWHESCAPAVFRSLPGSHIALCRLKSLSPPKPLDPAATPSLRASREPFSSRTRSFIRFLFSPQIGSHYAVQIFVLWPNARYSPLRTRRSFYLNARIYQTHPPPKRAPAIALATLMLPRYVPTQLPLSPFWCFYLFFFVFRFYFILFFFFGQLQPFSLHARRLPEISPRRTIWSENWS